MSKPPYTCDKCDFITDKRYNFIRHINSDRHREMLARTDKHNSSTLSDKKDKRIYECNICRKEYSIYKSFWSHKQACKDNNDNMYCNEVMPNKYKPNPFSLDVITQHDEFRQFMIDQNKQIMNKMQEMNQHIDGVSENLNMQIDSVSEKMTEIANKKHIIYNTNNTNNHFNLNLFLNVYCKDAMNLSDFMRSIDVQLHELEYMGEHGYVAGITKIITSRLSAMDVCKRPIHCSDLRREIIHIRENNEWIKDIDGEKTRAFVYNVNIINYKSVGKWMLAHPQCEVLDTPQYNQWLEIAKQSVNPGEGKDKRNLSIFKNVIKMCHIDKHAFRMIQI
jgi:hypothetical protein